jgi:DNA-binding transcriptional MerR regulator
MTQLIRIGDFSRLGRVSVVTLRHYDELGLLKPARIDAETGYRYYALEQLPRLHRILALKELNFSLEQVAQLLCDEVSVAQLRGMLLLKQAELERQVLEQQARLAAIEARLLYIEREGAVPRYDVALRPVAPQLVASLRTVAPTTDALERLFEEVEGFAARWHARADAAPLALYHDGEFREREADVEVAVPLDRRLSGAVGTAGDAGLAASPVAPAPPATAGHAHVSVRELPGTDAMACVVHAGSYTTIDQASSALFAWIAAQGYRVTGPYREVYLRFGAGGLKLSLPGAYLTEEAAEYLTELQVPVAQG